jgi:hypothetical protein
MMQAGDATNATMWGNKVGAQDPCVPAGPDEHKKAAGLTHVRNSPLIEKIK